MHQASQLVKHNKKIFMIIWSFLCRLSSRTFHKETLKCKFFQKINKEVKTNILINPKSCHKKFGIAILKINISHTIKIVILFKKKNFWILIN